MKTLHYRWNRSLNWILTTLLGFLGFSSCEDNGDDPGNIICMYGTPTASYTIKGKVTDQAGQALSDIQIIVSDMEFSYEPSASAMRKGSCCLPVQERSGSK